MLQGMAEHTEVSSSHSTEEVYEIRWRKGLDGWDKTDTIYLILKDSSYPKEVIVLLLNYSTVMGWMGGIIMPDSIASIMHVIWDLKIIPMYFCVLDIFHQFTLFKSHAETGITIYTLWKLNRNSFHYWAGFTVYKKIHVNHQKVVDGRWRSR